MLTANRRSQPEPVLDEIRWLFENSTTSLARLSRLYNVARTTLQYRINTEQWQRYVVPADPEQRARDLLAVQAMTGRLASARTRATDSSAGGDAGVPPITAASTASPRPALPNSAGPPAGQVIAFPVPGAAQEKGPAARTNAPETPSRIYKRVGMLRQRKADPVGEFQALLGDYLYLLRVYLRPDEHAEIDGLDPAEAEAAVAQLQAMARAILLPTERDSLSSAMKVGVTGIATLADLARAPAGSNGSPSTGSGTQTGGGRTVAIDRLSLDELRVVHAAIELLQGEEIRPSEPPKPPPPAPLPWMPDGPGETGLAADGN